MISVYQSITLFVLRYDMDFNISDYKNLPFNSAIGPCPTLPVPKRYYKLIFFFIFLHNYKKKKRIFVQT